MSCVVLKENGTKKKRYFALDKRRKIYKFSYAIDSVRFRHIRLLLETYVEIGADGDY